MVVRRGIERALDQIEAERGQQAEAALNTGPALPRSDSAKKEEVKRSVMREKRALAWKHLSLNERDVLTVLSAVCKASLSASAYDCKPAIWAPFCNTLSAWIRVHPFLVEYRLPRFHPLPM